MTTRWSRPVAALTAAAVALPLSAGAVAVAHATGTTSAAVAAAKPAPQDPAAPQFTDVEVHDPSLVTAGDEHYVFGSHLAAAKTEDFVQWEQVANHVTPDNPLFDDVTVELAETFEWAETSTLWAPDVIQLEADGRYYMYYNACRGDSPRSAMGIAVADDVDGPYTDLGIILRSGHRPGEGPSEDGTTYDARKHPNAVDPDVFYDAEGRLWMVYGSFSGGIFILELDPETGFPLPDQGYGTHLTGGNHSRIEGPTMMHHPETGYYYLFTSFGGLDAGAGYNMRVKRSENPDGPFVDAAGNDMRQVKSDPTKPIFDDVSIEPYGTKIMGNYLFQREVGAPGTGIGDGKVSPGHNTTYLDPATGEMRLIFHSRFPQMGEFHQVRAHEMFMNSEGWPVAAPYRFAGGHPAQKFQRMGLVGDYQLITHDKTISPEIRTAENVTLQSDGRISGAVEGRWRLYDENRLNLTIGGVAYDGVVSREWNPTTSEWVDSFSVLSAEGVSLWGSALAPMTDEEVVQAVLTDLDVPSPVVADVELPTVGTHGSTIAWTSSDPATIATDGTVTRPTGEDVAVTLTAQVTSGSATGSATFDVVVTAVPAPGLVARYAFDGDLAATDPEVAAGTVTGNRIDNTGGQVSFASGVHGQAVVLDGASGVRLPDGLIAGHHYSVSLWLKPERLTPFTTSFFGARNNTNWVSLVPTVGWGTNNTMLWSGSTRYYDGDTGTRLPVGEWSHVVFTVDGGEVTIYLDGQVVHTGSNFPDMFTTPDGVFALGVNWWDVPFQGQIDDLQVYLGELSAEQVAQVAAGEVAQF
ncbi:LamG-like jellyroll fold domain-containing protein [Isoptericola variabilis]|uniref:Glycoside hydrolase family 43 n=1 Tax=Isoptericola variabilis (strain 225) TaxID=743718 RepID=F6FRE2_ISOV2|nr:LamG-like jellyroll fold domain-containing protein [Isoptericola variabilis]AEG43903.1 glycoside hydrolase family 43 [Isoptericola variabilis 225]TWH30493.1 arabinan endo-1,5-alpha-L-arabinosidase [Isoptericola variabilis J7]